MKSMETKNDNKFYNCGLKAYTTTEILEKD